MQHLPTVASAQPATDQQEPLVSVIVPVYNGERYLEATLASALGQTHRNLEVIVIDDGSSDGSGRIVDSLARGDSRVRLLVQQNRGVSAARNRGIEASRGEFIAPLDADDIWEPSKIGRQVAKMRELGDRTGVVYSWWIWIDHDGRVLDYSPHWTIEGQAADALLQVNFTGCASMPLFRRSLLEQLGGYDQTLPQGCEDWDLVIRAAEQSAIGVVPRPLVAYRRRTDSMSSGTAAMWNAYVSFVQRLRGRRPDLDSAILRRSHDQFALHLAAVNFWGGHYAAAAGWGIRAHRSGLAFKVLPYVVRIVAGSLRGARSEPANVIGPCMPFADWNPGAPRLPYDRVHARYLERRRKTG